MFGWRLLLFFCGGVFFSSSLLAAPWQPPGDLLARHDLQLLSDEGVTNAPLSSWPVSLADFTSVRNAEIKTNVPWADSAAMRLRQQFRKVRRPGITSRESFFSVADNPLVFRSFQTTPRERAEAGSAIEWLGKRFAARLEVKALDDPADGNAVRFDGSYIAATFGNWIFSFGAQDRWWGPGWDGSLILSTSARPVPGFSFQRKQSVPFSWPILNWLGPWKLEGFAGRLENSRFVSHSKLLGARFSFRPNRDLEIGLSRTAQWGGEGRPEDLDSLIDLILGRDNRGSEGISLSNEPGNQLAGIDWRWRPPLFRSCNYAIYGQIVGEDEAGGFPSRPMGLGGLEHWGGAFAGSYRVYLEVADTSLDFYHSSVRYNKAYEHFIYKTGYRYKGRPLGHTMDNDGQSASLGWLWSGPAGIAWGGHLLYARLNRDGEDVLPPGGNLISLDRKSKLRRILFFHQRQLGRGKLFFQAGAAFWDSDQGDDTDLILGLSWNLSL
ncbi:hypothetical protein B5V00_11840 [Geothermobacter hydrogeniphilus]|uniref:Capsule assembly protein Wzi n=1 Tax=Geothermobacter hydrogeniphilus TaxID=1969733 RepID=A0A1X0Y0S2_9BACT|nr:hypothetical protein B5V00_11840 [Geothermobacter hydrogeniphilus]